MSDKTDTPTPRASNVRGILLLMAALPPLAVALHALAGLAVAAAASGIYAVSLGLTLLTERNEDVPSRDPSTGLPDRDAALARLERIFSQNLAGSSQAGVFVVSLASEAEEVPGTEMQPMIVLAAARLAQSLRRGDQIIQVGEHSLAAILGPSRGLTARAGESILARIDRMFREPMRIGSRTMPSRIALGACLQHDAPKADARSWLEAAELAAEVAAEAGEPRLFPSGAIKVDRSAWDDYAAAGSLPETEGDVLWRTTAEGRADDTAKDRPLRRQRA